MSKARWWKKEDIPQGKNFWKIITSLVFECPVSYQKRSKTEETPVHIPVSKRGCSFRERGIEKGYLNSILSMIKKPLVKNNAYKVLLQMESVEEEVQGIIAETTCGDKEFEIIVMKRHPDMPDTQAIYYYIRNAFAHGSFMVKKVGRDRDSIYYLESENKGTVRARMRLKEKTLLEYAGWAQMTPEDIRKKRQMKK